MRSGKKLQEMRNEITKNKENKITLRNNKISEPSKNTDRTNQTNNDGKTYDEVKTYSQIVQQDNGKGAQEKDNINETLLKLLEKLEKQNQKYEEQGQTIKDVL